VSSSRMEGRTFRLTVTGDSTCMVGIGVIEGDIASEEQDFEESGCCLNWGSGECDMAPGGWL
jgi:hypothetical protein